MKTIILSFLLVSSFSFAQSNRDCHLCLRHLANAIELPREVDQLGNVTAEEKREFMRRTAYPSGGWTLALSIETNFKVPLVGKQNYFGKIFFKKGDTVIRYRDEILARNHYRDESVHPQFYNTSRFSIGEMNSPGGNDVASGVRLIGRNFNSNAGGRLIIQVDPPGSGPVSIPMDVRVVNNRAVTSLNVNGGRIEFTSLKINAKGGSVLRGVENVQFFKNGRLVHTLTN